MLSNQKIINELKDIQNAFIKTRPKMDMNSFVSSRKESYNLGDGSKHRLHTFLQGGGAPMIMKHPLGYGNINGNTLHPDPLYSGIVYRPTKGGAVLGERMPLEGGEYSSSEYSESDSECEGGDLMSESSEGEYSSDEEGEIGGDVYDDYVKPAGKTLSKGLYNVGKFAFNDVVVPLGKELLKKAIVGAIVGAGHPRVYGGMLTGTKEEFYHILKKIEPHFKLSRKHTKNDLRNEVYKHLESTMSKKDLETLHYLDTLASYDINPNQKYGIVKSEGGLNGKKAELQQILKKMYPNIDFNKLTKKQIVEKITHHVNTSKADDLIIKQEKQRNKIDKKLKEQDEEINFKLQNLLPLGTSKQKLMDDGSFDEEVEFIHPEEKVIKEKKPRGRPKVIKEPKEKKPRGRPKVIKEPKEKKPRGRPKVIKNTPIKKPSKNEEKQNLKQKLKGMTNAELIKFTKTLKVPKKLIGTKKGNRARGDIVAEYAKKHNVSMIEASKKVKELNLY
jgi:hypothetical protein